MGRLDVAWVPNAEKPSDPSRLAITRAVVQRQLEQALEADPEQVQWLVDALAAASKAVRERAEIGPEGRHAG